MVIKIIASVIYGCLALLVGAGAAYQMYKGESTTKSSLWLLIFTLGIAAIWI